MKTNTQIRSKKVGVKDNAIIVTGDHLVIVNVTGCAATAQAVADYIKDLPSVESAYVDTSLINLPN